MHPGYRLAVTLHLIAVHSLLILALSGCAHHATDPDPVAEVRYRVDIDATFATAVEGRAMPALESLSDTGLELHLEISLARSREFRDGSQGALVRFERAWADSRIGDAAPARIDPAGLEGRSVELRTFPGKEILALDLIEHVSGGDRQADVFELIWPVLAPFPPPLDEGGAASRTVGWPFRLSRLRGVRNELNLHWRNGGLGEQGGVAAWELDYEGPWTLRGADRATSPPTLITAEGRARGTAWYRAADSELVAHEFDWERVVEHRPVGPDAEAVVVSQRQHFVGRLERTP